MNRAFTRQETPGERHAILIFLGPTFCCGDTDAGFAAMQLTATTPTVLTFDEFPSFTAFTTQYQSLGFPVSGAVVLEGSEVFQNANTFPNLYYSPFSVMTFIIGRLTTGDIQTISVLL